MDNITLYWYVVASTCMSTVYNITIDDKPSPIKYILTLLSSGFISGFMLASLASYLTHNFDAIVFAAILGATGSQRTIRFTLGVFEEGVRKKIGLDRVQENK